MSEFDWAASRGEKWLAQIDELEAMLKPLDVPLLSSIINATSSVPLRIADIACGAGGTTLALEKRAPTGSVIHGIDISEALISYADSRARDIGSKVEFYHADLQAELPSKGEYDALISRFGTMFFDQPATAFSNIRRWLKPNGQFSFAVWGDPAKNPWMTSLRDVAKQYVDLPRPEPDAPGPFRYADVRSLKTELQKAGFRQLQVQEWLGDLALGGGLDATAAADFALSAFSVAEPLLQAGESTFGKARKALIDRYQTYQKQGTVLMGAHVHIISGKA